MKIKKYLFRSLYNISVENIFLFKSNTCVMGLYRNKRLVGCMRQNGSPFSVYKLVEQIEEIFPIHYLNIGKWKKENTHIGIYSDENPRNIHYFDANNNELFGTQGKFFLDKKSLEHRTNSSTPAKKRYFNCWVVLTSFAIGIYNF